MSTCRVFSCVVGRRCLLWPVHFLVKTLLAFDIWSITTNKARGGDGIPVELFQILKDDVFKVLHSKCQQIGKTQQWPQDWKRSVFITISKKGNAKEAEVEWFYEDTQDLSRTNTPKRCPFHHRGLECKSRELRDTLTNRQVWPWNTK